MKLSMALLLVAVLIPGVLPGTATASPLWSSAPNPFPCGGPGNSIVRSNACLSQTGFNPNHQYWGQVANPRGNCTNYVAYRLARNGARQLASSFGNAVGWKSVVQSKLGAKAANRTPKVGAIAWWGAHGAPGVSFAGHVAGGDGDGHYLGLRKGRGADQGLAGERRRLQIVSLRVHESVGQGGWGRVEPPHLVRGQPSSMSRR